jgi:hypothetical protein
MAVTLPMPPSPATTDLLAEIAAIRTEALSLRTTVQSRLLKQSIDAALGDIAAIPQMFDDEVFVRAALTLPRSSIRAVRDLVDQWGPMVVFGPHDS